MGHSEVLKENVKFQRNGHPRKVTIATDRQITRAAAISPKRRHQPLREIQQALVLDISITTEKWRPREKNIKD